MIAEIEEAVIARLKDKGLEAGEIKVQKGTDGLVKPAVFVAAEGGKFERVSNSTFKLTVDVSVYVVFKSFKNEADRRKGLHPLLEGAVGILMLQDLGLKISPLKPTAFKDFTDDRLSDLGLMACEIGFETSYYLEKMNDQAATDLLKVGLSFFLQPGDVVQDAADTINLGV